MVRLAATLPAAILLASCAMGLSPSDHATAAAVSVQPVDVPADLARCPGSGTIDSYLKAAKAKDPAAYGRMGSQWKGLQAEGADDGAVVVASDNPDSCSSDQFGAEPKTRAVSSLVARFQDDQAAIKAWQKGVLGFKAPQPGRREPDLTQGVTTGLGINAWSFDRQVEGDDLHLSSWQHGLFVLFVLVENLSADQAQQIVTAMDGRSAEPGLH